MESEVSETIKCPLPADNPMETTKWKVKNTKLKKAVCSVWIYCRVSCSNPGFFSELDTRCLKTLQRRTFLPLPCLCFTGITVPSCLYHLFLSWSESFLCFDRRALRKHFFVIFKSFDVEDMVTLPGGVRQRLAVLFL